MNGGVCAHEHAHGHVHDQHANDDGHDDDGDSPHQSIGDEGGYFLEETLISQGVLAWQKVLHCNSQMTNFKTLKHFFLLMRQTKLKKAQEYCESHGLRFTQPREVVLTILLNEKTPLGAYEILAKLSEFIPDPKPQTVYRAVNFWLEHGFIHVIDSLKSYVACCQKQHFGQAQFLICGQCSKVTELACSLDLAPIYAQARKMNFSIASSVVEIKGRCAPCS